MVHRNIYSPKNRLDKSHASRIPVVLQRVSSKTRIY